MDPSLTGHNRLRRHSPSWPGLTADPPSAQTWQSSISPGLGLQSASTSAPGCCGWRVSAVPAFNNCLLLESCDRWRGRVCKKQRFKCQVKLTVHLVSHCYTKFWWPDISLFSFPAALSCLCRKRLTRFWILTPLRPCSWVKCPFVAPRSLLWLSRSFACSRASVYLKTWHLPCSLMSFWGAAVAASACVQPHILPDAWKRCHNKTLYNTRHLTSH